uniref:Exosome component 4 n=1 Tax=Oryza sativa subsp. japonica TaxID=39947 RepID=Q6K293_ORYSJ|nr:putative exosome component 4 [Oryza sativa Japonica Group]BAD22495.1 putative exosome component 4 [Oryza sativa Japonica Group]
MEYVNPLTGFRVDGRRPNEMRQLKGEVGVVARADGSALFEMGNTRVIAAVYGPREVAAHPDYWLVRLISKKAKREGLRGRSRTKVSKSTAKMLWMADFSTGDRRRKPKGDRRSTEISLVIRQTMEASILTHLMPRSQIDIFVQVLQADGGTRAACINAATLALADAGIPMRDIVTSCSADLNYIEDSAGGPDVTVGFLTKMDKVTLLQMDAKLPMDTFETVMDLAIEGCKAIANYIRELSLSNDV